MTARAASPAEGFAALYYPFSRSIDPCSTKQMLLVFDSVHFLDPVDDDAWRAHLMREMEDANDPRFGQFRAIGRALPTLIKEGAVVRRDPAELSCSTDPLVSAAALTDLQDSAWTAIASNPSTYRMPHRRDGGGTSATWEIFRPKLPDAFLEAIDTQTSTLGKHLIIPGDDERSWIVSYQAGSAIALSLHLAAAQELELSPVTDSRMHHLLLLQRTARVAAAQSDKSRPLLPRAIEQIATGTAISLIDSLLPRTVLEEATFDQILEFRAKTRDTRWQFVRELRRRLSLVNKSASVADFEQAAEELRHGIDKELREYQADLGGVRDKVWPTLTDSVKSSLSGGGLAAIAANYLLGPGYAVAAAGVAAGLALLKGMLDLRAEERKSQAKVAAPISYLSHVRGEFGP